MPQTKNSYRLKSEVIVYPGMGGWRFLIIPHKQSAAIKTKHGKTAKGWGSLPVSVTIRKTEWRTSIFPDKKSGTYLLPLKAQVRTAEKIADHTHVAFVLRIL